MIDTFTFHDELDLLEIRLNSLAPYVRKFILAESPITHSGKPKPLYYQENRKRFSLFNIEGIVVNLKENSDPWVLEKQQREALNINDALPGEIVLLSDVDEIPDLRNFFPTENGVFKQKLYYYYCNTYTGKANWKGTVAYLRKDISDLNELRYSRWKMPTIGTGWHFSTLGSVEKIINKIESFAHQELNTPIVKNEIANRRAKLLDPYDRNKDKLIVEMPSGLSWLLENKDKYSHLFYKEGL